MVRLFRRAGRVRWVLGSALPFSLLGCSSSLGGAVVHAVHPDSRTAVGFETTTMASLSLLDTQADVALGLKSRILHRLTGPQDAFGQWRLQLLLGLTHMPQPRECWVGYEILLAPGMGRYYYSGDDARLGGALGLLGALPLRLSAHAPPWRSDDLIAANVYLVPEVGANYVGNNFELSAGLSVRTHFWSQITP
jgi:hypothetical protein